MNQVKTKIGWQQWLLLLAFVGLTIFIYSRFTNLPDVIKTLGQGVWYWIVIGIVIHVVFFLMETVLYKFSFDTVEVESTVPQLLPVVFGALFLNAIVPSGGAAGGALYVADAVCHGQSGARAAVGALLAVLADLWSLLPFVVIGIIYLQTHGQLQPYDSVAGGLFVLFISILGFAILLAGWKPNLLSTVLGWIESLVNRVGGWLKRPNLLGEDWAKRTADELDAAAVAISDHPDRLARTVGWGFIMHVVNFAGLYAFFLAFQARPRLGTLVAGFAMGIVFYVIAIIPQGVAAVEGIMSLVFTSLGVPSSKTVAIVFAFRGVNFYLPVILGFFSTRYIARLLRATASNKSGRQSAPCEQTSESSE